jgi:hypothetical protein
MSAFGAILTPPHGLPVLVARLCVWLLILAALFIPLERLFFLRPGKLFRSGFLIDFAYYLMNGVLRWADRPWPGPAVDRAVRPRGR